MKTVVKTLKYKIKSQIAGTFHTDLCQKGCKMLRLGFLLYYYYYYYFVFYTFLSICVSMVIIVIACLQRLVDYYYVFLQKYTILTF